MNNLFKSYILVLLICAFSSCNDSKNTSIEIDSISTPASLSIASLASKQLEVSVGPENITREYSLTYNSSDSSIVSVSKSGLLTAKNGGTAVVTVSVDGHSDIKSKSMITVVPFSLNADDSISMKVGENVQMIATLYPIPPKACTLSWESSNPNVATIDNSGNVTGISAGSSTILIRLNEIPNITFESQITVFDSYTGPSDREIYVTPLESFNIAESFNSKYDLTFQCNDDSFIKFTSDKDAYALQDGEGYIYAYLNGETTPCDSLLVHAISLVEIPDANFRKRIITLYDANKDNLIQINEISGVTTLSITSLKIADLTGIEYFSSLETLNCSYNLLETLDVSKNKKLLKLYCHYNNLHDLNVTGDSLLNYIHCGYNDLTSVDISTNKALVTFICTQNQISSLDISKNEALTSLTCSYNQLEEIDLSHNTLLATMVCTNNNISSLDLTNNLKISTLTCNNNVISEIIFNESKNHSLSSFNCENNKLTNLNLTTCKSIVNLYAGSNRLTNIDLTKSTKLQILSCELNKLESLDLSLQTVLVQLICNDNRLTDLITKSNALTKLWCNGNALTDLNISNDTALLQLLCQNNELSTIDLSKNIGLRNIIISYNKLTSLDVSKNSNLNFLNCIGNPLTTLYCNKNADQEAWSIPASTLVIFQ